MATCCPPGSLGPAPLSSQTPKGRMEIMTSDDSNDDNDSILPMPCYCTGAPLASASRVVVIFTDVFGLESGNHKVVADALSEQLEDGGTAVIIPDIFRGNPIAVHNSRIPVVAQLVWNMSIGFDHGAYDKDMQHLMLPWIQSQMKSNDDKFKKNMACVGFCFGGWCVARALALANESSDNDDKSDDNDNNKTSFSMTCGVGIHPALKPEAMRQAGQALLAERMGAKPVLWLSAGNDELKAGEHAAVKVNAEARGIPETEVAIEFPDMIHGWVTRGDSADETIAQEQQRALQLTADFINKHCPVV